MLNMNCKIMDHFCRIVTVSHHLLICIAVRNDQYYLSIENMIRRRGDKQFLFLLSVVCVFISLVQMFQWHQVAFQLPFFQYRKYLWSKRHMSQWFRVVMLILGCMSLAFFLVVVITLLQFVRWLQAFVQFVSLWALALLYSAHAKDHRNRLLEIDY